MFGSGCFLGHKQFIQDKQVLGNKIGLYTDFSFCRLFFDLTNRAELDVIMVFTICQGTCLLHLLKVMFILQRHEQHH